MQEPAASGAGEARWEYRILWRYGALLLAAVGLLAMGFGAAGVCGTAISVTLLPLGFISLVAGMVLPRIEGKFTAGPSGLSAEMLAVHLLDRPSYVVSGPALASEQPDGAAAGELEMGAETSPADERIKLGDVWDALDAAGFRPYGVGMGSAHFNLPDGRSLQIPNRGFLDHGIASDELLALLASWNVRPAAGGKYPMPTYANQEQVVRPFVYKRPPS
jgi:hypothetical protein